MKKFFKSFCLVFCCVFLFSVSARPAHAGIGSFVENQASSAYNYVANTASNVYNTVASKVTAATEFYSSARTAIFGGNFQAAPVLSASDAQKYLSGECSESAAGAKSVSSIGCNMQLQIIRATGYTGSSGIAGIIAQGMNLANTATGRMCAAIFSVDFLSTPIQEITDVFMNLSNREFLTLTSTMFTIVEYLFAIWVIIQCVYLFLGIEEFRKVFWKISLNSGIFIFISMLIGAASSSVFWNYFIVLPLQLCSSIMDALNSATGTPDATSCQTTISSSLSMSGASSLGSMVGCIQQHIDSDLKPGIAIGFSILLRPILLTIGLIAMDGDVIALALFLFWGSLLVSGGFIIAILYFAFLLIDFVSRICIVACLAPLFIGFAILPATRGYTIASFNQLLATFVGLCASSLVISICASIMSLLIGNPDTGDLLTLAPQIQSKASIMVTTPAFFEIGLIGYVIIFLTKTVVNLMGGIFGVSHLDWTSAMVEKAGLLVAGVAIGGMVGGPAGAGKAAASGMKHLNLAGGGR